MLDSLIIGAGTSEFSLAHALQQNLSRRIWVTQRQGRVGGNITANQVAKFLEEDKEDFVSFPAISAVLNLGFNIGFKQKLVLAEWSLPLSFGATL